MTTELLEHYHHPTDRKFDRFTRQGSPKANKAFLEMNQAAFDPEGVVPLKTKELMALAIALTTQCAWCIEAHSKGAKAQGATKEEIAETITLTATMRASAGMAHGRMAWKFYLSED
ncbi:carboxymuconolactone decarboxylase family protein [Pseudarthrobacter sp. YAF2]|uniref:carboxymuconolactone decarboxylase family protein n=1 Tax=Pseudarthrobacter sp. YAF2 TaxID=3233078 RepID=UPI003F97E911